MSIETREAGSETKGDGFQPGKQDIDDLLTTISSLATHPGLSLVGDVLPQMTELRHRHHRLLEETQRQQSAHEQQIKNLEEKDEAFRQKSLKDYTDNLEVRNKEKDRLSKENENLKMQIEQQIKATQAAEQLLKTQLETADITKQKMQEHEEGANSANRKLQEVQKKLSEAQQSAKSFNATLQRRDQAESKLKEEAATARKEVEDLNKRNDRLQKQLEKRKGYLAPPSDVALTKLTEELNEVWQSSLKLVKTSVSGDLSDSTLKNKIIWQNTEKLAPGLPLPHSNSPSAKAMRASLMLSVLAKAFVRYVFTTTYLLSERGELDDLLDILAGLDSTHEYFARSVLLGLFPKDEAQMIRDRVTGMIDHVTSDVRDIISPDGLEGFKSGLNAVAEKSTQVWVKLQRNQIHFEAISELNAGVGLGWKTSKSPLETAEAFGDLISCGPENAVLTIFPQLLAVENGEDKSVFPGIVVAKSQLGQAEKEARLEKTSAATSVENRSPRSRARTTGHSHGTTSTAATNGFLGGR